MTISREAQALIDYVESAGIPYRVTDVNTPGVHTETSWHYAPGDGGIGTAVDFGGAIAGVTPTTVVQMTDIWRAFLAVASKLAELFFQAPGIQTVVKNGALRPALTVLDANTWNAHRNHVHVAVKPGTFLTVTGPAYPVVTVAARWDPPLQVVDFLPYWGGGGGWLLFPDGGLGAVGDAPFRGEANQPRGHPYWGDRRAARIERLGDNGYTIVATSGERYDYR